MSKQYDAFRRPQSPLLFSSCTVEHRANTTLLLQFSRAVNPLLPHPSFHGNDNKQVNNRRDTTEQSNMCSTESTQSAISEALNGESVSTRTRALFALRGCGPNSPEGVRAVEEVLLSDASALIRHEAAYVLGQMSARSAIPTLQKVLENENEDVMVRHEAAEALGAIADPSTRPILEVYAKREGIPQEIKETCIIALDRIDHVINGTLPPENKSECNYTSVDPAEPSDASASVEDLESQLSDGEIGMYTRYAAMFSLRNKGGEDAVLALCRAMESEKDSALFRHEIAYVLGQMQHPASIPTLEKFLRKRDEHEMVRHEAAEALGSIASDRAIEILKHFIEDSAQVVRESVHVALDISDYNTSNELHYASTTPSLSSSITQETSLR